MLLRDILNLFDEFAPFALQEDYDNSGIQVGDPLQEVSRGLICLDVTEEVMDEAVQKKCDLIVSHHPVIFKGLKKLTGSHYTERVIIKAIRENISIISVHTNLDSVAKGVNGKLAEKLGLMERKILQPQKGLLKKLVVFCPKSHADLVRDAVFSAGAGQIGEYDCCSFNLEGNGSFRGSDLSSPFAGQKGKLHFEAEVRIETILPEYLSSKVLNAMLKAHPYEEVAWDMYSLDNYFSKVGPGMIGYLPDSVNEAMFLENLKEVLGVPVIRHSGFKGRSIHKVALCGGSGSFLRGAAMVAGADVFVTADVKYHDFFDAQEKMLLADVGHYESEQFTKEILYEILSKKNTNFALLISNRNVNPVHYF